MIAIGTDILAVRRVEQLWGRHGPRLSRRVLTAAERLRMDGVRQPWRFVAKRFAAKEAVAKCLGCGIGVALSWQDITIDATARGEPRVTLSPRALALARQRGGSRVLLSISDEHDYAVAFAALVA